jgi:GMP synthase-like glutamine amidotransferase
VELVVLEHEPDAGVAGLRGGARRAERTTPWRRVDVLDGGPLPHDLDLVAGLVVMGGRMSATHPAAYTWMPAELELLRQAVLAEVPVLGVCLGAQLLGSALGGEVTSSGATPGGVRRNRRTGAAAGDPVLGGWPEGAAPLFVHEDEVTRLPVDAVPLLTISDRPVRRWSPGERAPRGRCSSIPRSTRTSWRDGRPTRDSAPCSRAPAWSRRRSPPTAGSGRFAVAHGRALVGRFLDGPVRSRLT